MLQMLETPGGLGRLSYGLPCSLQVELTDSALSRAGLCLRSVLPGSLWHVHYPGITRLSGKHT